MQTSCEEILHPICDSDRMIFCPGLSRAIYNYSYFCSFKIRHETKDEKEHAYV
ncbi:hypothetical protein TFKS16_2673 [Tannerella forsythia KS16]|uniref:Uncharacterized protein n=1 Tax=Tannerella forsythia (strain ATCC 43037 / JCM 10827 / CCUG 21028 A / KCTC 5666 / FDC 338) TaxID=203275 RepID=G8UPB7_TANFA|nr:hypothetical protein BFO_2952 [Tannerella forsythia 92A2]BAR50024.1 hypothetical protein TF3313_2595 [Tannerella forsythia 3313]BAR52851.1 hypothetical protein TFKS16_2673 [Tannerella forsythia KS16]